MSGLPKWNRVVRTTAGAISDSSCRLMGILIDSEHADWEIEFTNTDDGSGTAVIQLGGEAESCDSRYLDFSSLGGIYFSTALWMRLAATGATVHCFIDGSPSTATNPGDIAGLVLWLDASAQSYANNASVTTWTDSSSKGHDFSEATNPPTFKTNILNALPVVRFDGVNDVLSMADHNDLDLATTFTIFAVYQSTGDPVGLITHYDGGGAFNGWGFTQGHGPTVGTRLSLWTNVKSAWDEDNAALGDAGFHIAALAYSSGSGQFYRDGTAGAALTGHGITASTNVVYLGADAIGGSLAAIDFAEVLVYSSALSAANLAIVGNYLEAKYGLTWA